MKIYKLRVFKEHFVLQSQMYTQVVAPLQCVSSAAIKLVVIVFPKSPFYESDLR